MSSASYAVAVSEAELSPEKPVERLFPFLVRSRKLIVGREALARSRRRLHSVLISSDISDSSKAEILRDFADYPILQKYTAAEIESYFGVRNAKVLGFEKSSLAKSIYNQLKGVRLNGPKEIPK